MTLRTTLLLLGLCGALGLNVAAAPRALARARAAAPAMQFGRDGRSGAPEKLPRGWKKVPSESRPGKFSYLDTRSGQRYDKPPGSAVYDDDRDAQNYAPWAKVFAFGD